MEVWYFRIPNTYSSSSCSFVAEFNTDDKMHWDNNSNQNYRLAWHSPTQLLKNCTVVLDRVSRNLSTLSGNIILRNLSYKKQVKLLYSEDNWSTCHEAEALFDTSISESLENWKFSFLTPSQEKVKLVVQYEIDGITFRDNNFGHDYVL